MPKLFNYAEPVPKAEFSKMTSDALEEELSIVTQIIEEMPTADQYIYIRCNKHLIIEVLEAKNKAKCEFYLVQSPRHETSGTLLFGAFSLRRAQRLMAKIAVQDGTEDAEPQDLDNWNLDTMNYYLSIVTLAGTDDED